MSMQLAELHAASAASGGSFDLAAMIVAAAQNASKYNVTVDGKPVDYDNMLKSINCKYGV
jgi:hypothetical protein